MIYGSPSSGAGWIVPKAYYEKVGKDGFKNAPIGAGPYRFVRQRAGSELELEAFTDYWRKVPSIKTLLFLGIPETATRFAVLKTGEVDAAYQIQGDLFQTMRQDPALRVTVVQGNPTWLEMATLDNPDHPLKDVRVRQAISLAIDRKAVNDAELGGTSSIGGNWIRRIGQGRSTSCSATHRHRQGEAAPGRRRLPQRLRRLGAHAVAAVLLVGRAAGSQLRAINVKTTMNTMERAAFYDAMGPGPSRLKGFVLMFSARPRCGHASGSAVTNGTFSGLSIPEIDDWMKQYDSSTDMQERKAGRAGTEVHARAVPDDPGLSQRCHLGLWPAPE